MIYIIGLHIFAMLNTKMTKEELEVYDKYMVGTLAGLSQNPSLTIQPIRVAIIARDIVLEAMELRKTFCKLKE